MHDDLELLRLIDEGTASETGAGFFDALVRSLAHALGTRYAFVSRFSEDRAHVKVLAFWNGAGVDHDVRYELAGTPCERVLDGRVVTFDRGVSELYPAEKAIGAESYLAIPLQGSDGGVLGHLAVIHTEPVNWQERDLGILRIFASRAAAEIRRESMDEALRATNAALERRVELEALITNISTRFVSVELADIDREIESAVGTVAQFARSDRARVLRLTPDAMSAKLSHEWVRDNIAFVACHFGRRDASRVAGDVRSLPAQRGAVRAEAQRRPCQLEGPAHAHDAHGRRLGAARADDLRHAADRRHRLPFCESRARLGTG
jgi:hypothetical protein